MVFVFLLFLLPFLTCPVCLGESGEGHVSPLGLSFLISEDKGRREMQLQRVRSRPLGPCTALGYVFTYF